MTQWAACIGGAALHKLPLTSPAVAPSRCSAGQHPSSRSPQLPSSAAVSHLWRDGDPTIAPTWKHQHQQPLVTPRAGNGARRMAWAGRAQFRRALFRGWCCCGCSSWCCFRWPELLGLLCLVRARPSVSSVSVSLPVPPRVSKPVESPSPSPSLHSRVIVVDKTPVPRPLSLTITTKNQSSIPQTWSRPVRAQPSRAHRGSPCVWPWPGSGRAAL